MQFWAPDDGRKNRLKHVERLTDINKLRNVASCWLYSENILVMHGHMNVKCTPCSVHNCHSCYTVLQTDKLTTHFNVCFTNRLTVTVATCISTIKTWRPIRPLFWYWRYHFRRVLSSIVWWMKRYEWWKTMIEFKCLASNGMIYT